MDFLTIEIYLTCLTKIYVITFVPLLISWHHTIDFSSGFLLDHKISLNFHDCQRMLRICLTAEKCVRSEIGKVAWEFDNKFAFCTFVYKTERKVTFVLWKFHEILFKFSRFLNQDADVIVYKEVSKFPVIFCLPENHEESYSENAENIALTFSALDVFGKD